MKTWPTFKVVGDPLPFAILEPGPRNEAWDDYCRIVGPVLPSNQIDHNRFFFAVIGAPAGGESYVAWVVAATLHRLRHPAPGQPQLVCERFLARRLKRCDNPAELAKMLNPQALTYVSALPCPDAKEHVRCVKAEIRDLGRADAFWTIDARVTVGEDHQQFDLLAAEVDYYYVFY